jgi:hypothetical protein
MLASLGEFCLQLSHLRLELLDLLTQTPTLLTGMGFWRSRHTDEIVVLSSPETSRPRHFVLLATSPALDIVLALDLI